ncbi:hypothetical protein EON66_02380 [archaeon]|nr:MAG: hypothetical protein EON66_02380 [archaeon]
MGGSTGGRATSTVSKASGHLPLSGSAFEDDAEEDELSGAPESARTLSRELPITVSTRLEMSSTDPCRVKLMFGTEGERESHNFEVIFPSAYSLNHFAGTLRSLTYGVDTAAARLLGVHRAGIAPDVLSIFVSSFNVGDQRPPKDLSMMHNWIPAHRYDLLVVGLQECNARVRVCRHKCRTHSSCGTLRCVPAVSLFAHAG